MDAIAAIKNIYYAATRATIQDDLDRAIDLLKTLPSEEERDRVAVYMDGLVTMKSEWRQAARGGVGATATGSRPPAGARRSGGPPARSDRSKSSSRRTR